MLIATGMTTLHGVGRGGEIYFLLSFQKHSNILGQDCSCVIEKKKLTIGGKEGGGGWERDGDLWQDPSPMGCLVNYLLGIGMTVFHQHVLS